MGAGIIPARAGSTNGPPPTPRSCRDHPRSRGVDNSRRPSTDSGWGSSPLARGRPISVRAELNRHGIIPARAGSTRRRCGSTRQPPDHPRSRGVDQHRELRELLKYGSSPLARGRPGLKDSQQELVGIIPARAGSTRRSRTSRPPTGDHPRSRGVDPATGPSSHSCVGSSPLARGRLSAGLFPRSWSGIIPARAGSTCKPAEAEPHLADHPRSRGVDAIRSNVIGNDVGSSPLARGRRAVPG